MAKRIDYSSKDKISPLGISILSALFNLKAVQGNEKDAFSIASMSAKKDPNITTLQKFLSNNGPSKGLQTLQKELTHLETFGLVAITQKNIIGQPQSVSYQITLLGVKKLEEYSSPAGTATNPDKPSP